MHYNTPVVTAHIHLLNVFNLFKPVIRAILPGLNRSFSCTIVKCPKTYLSIKKKLKIIKQALIAFNLGLKIKN